MSEQNIASGLDTPQDHAPRSKGQSPGSLAVPPAKSSIISGSKRHVGRFIRWLLADDTQNNQHLRVIYPRPIDHLREQEMFLNEVTKELRELEISVNELTSAVKHR